MESLLSYFSAEVLLVFAVNLLLIVLLLILNISNRKKIKKLYDKYSRFTNDFGDVNIEQLLEKCIDELKVVSGKSKSIENHINNVERNLIQCVQKVGVVRYNAFEDVGSDLSFSVALLNGNNDGIVLSSIYSRDNSIVYAKPITAGKSKYTLSAEELQALEIARKN
ncbi:hypothetical protein CDQ84_09595 [Clostridium thermosuccinogenes]|jgi:hypothetical protein|uniref:DUF4446 domain-containing protein n=1 Tax=Clostridium thermosuccinogenes TaxID=84032 RepID=A0A2K2FJN2_9CLOT|nr:DUF4446 family protein [Pseudoclostridium thermosuccinogenes]AUS98489.1 hypothetical protein CDO33_19740 [Pseudoclostridium thermosuccinogenes]PNT90846.1 hypothetical protein CDQ83_13450 [Pseudoclostridium thermosuccinogenes]PNT97058.1 hypothetical protein CDQ85_09445 [Pseudoclostridium thermosuccinogenes]PNT98989.1 hypothetical protein CDQ84_09595 [Pseudoclostridium thermosuccinogenes]